uniref:E3 ubiquitin-protein ligase DCST1 n=1 Tax=Petromyzon marinus TaxID=7757 RepID=A0AAJ7SRX9_PETMA|nr:E3 ubiquitin-protein ligase DCST1 [Petromyzon marinus]
MESALPGFVSRYLLSPPWQHRMLKILINGILGILIGQACYYVTLDWTGMQAAYKLLVLVFLTVFFGFGWAFSRHVRCSTVLMAPCVCSNVGCSVIMAIAASLLFTGPMTNMMLNAKESGQSLACLGQQQIEHAKVIVMIAAAPVRTLFDKLIAASKDLEKSSDEAKELFQLIKQEVLGGKSSDGGGKTKRDAAQQQQQEDGQQLQPQPQQQQQDRRQQQQEIEAKYISRVRFRCWDVFEKGVEKCREMFTRKWDECLDTIVVPLINHILCLPLKFDFLCPIIHVFDGWCETNIPMLKDFGDVYDRIQQSIAQLKEQFMMNPQVEYTQQPMSVDEDAVKGMLTNIRSSINSQVSKVMAFVKVLQMLLGLVGVVLYSACSGYVNKYNGDVVHDNMYLTRYFRIIDARRRAKKQQTLLPPKRAEVVKYVNPCSLRMSEDEQKSFYFMAVILGVQILMMVFLLIVDWCIVVFINIFAKHSKVEYNIKGVHELRVDVNGKSMLANVLRILMRALETNHTVNAVSDNYECLPQSKAMSWKMYGLILGIYSALVFIMVSQGYVLRLRRVICAFFYPKREKTRVVHLYNDYLRRRKGFLKFAKKLIAAKAKQRVRPAFSIVKMLARKWPKFFGWLSHFVSRACVVCGQTNPGEPFSCPNTKCRSLYCRPCWRDVGKVCYSCTTDRDPERLGLRPSKLLGPRWGLHGVRPLGARGRSAHSGRRGRVARPLGVSDGKPTRTTAGDWTARVWGGKRGTSLVGQAVD